MLSTDTQADRVPSRPIASSCADHELAVAAFCGRGDQLHDDRLFSGVVQLFASGYAALLGDRDLFNLVPEARP